MSKVPAGWVNIFLGTIAKNITSGSRDWSKYYSDVGDKFVRMTNLNRDGIHLLVDNMKYVNVVSSSRDGERTSLEYGDVLISITAELGKIGWVPEGFGKAYINQHTALLRFNNELIDSKFIAYQLSSPRLNKIINSLNDAGAKSGLNLSTIRNIPIIICPLYEQTKIAQILSTWDKAIATTEKLIGNSQQQKKALMQSLLTGKKRLPGFEGEWTETTLGEISKPQQWSTITSSQLTPAGFRVYGANGFIGYYSEYNHELECVTVTCRGSTCGEVSLIPRKSYITGNSMCLDDIEPSINAYRYIYYSLSYRGFDDVISGSAQPQIVGSAIKKIKVKLPPLPEQQKIAAVLTAADNEIELLQKKLAFLKQEKAALMQQLLTGKRRVKVEAA